MLAAQKDVEQALCVELLADVVLELVVLELEDALVLEVFELLELVEADVPVEVDVLLALSVLAALPEPQPESRANAAIAAPQRSILCPISSFPVSIHRRGGFLPSSQEAAICLSAASCRKFVTGISDVVSAAMRDVKLYSWHFCEKFRSARRIFHARPKAMTAGRSARISRALRIAHVQVRNV